MNGFESKYLARNFLKKKKDRPSIAPEQQEKIFMNVPRKKLVEEVRIDPGTESDDYGFADSDDDE